jgi:serine/threonine protein kinase
MHTLETNFVLNQKYTILNTIAQGGFGITYAAVDGRTGNRVCIKELFISGCSTRAVDKSVVSMSLGGIEFPDFMNKFIVEAKQLSKFNHPSIVRVIDFFKENKTAYIVMDFLEGETLKDLVRRSGPLPFEFASSLIVQIIDALELIHKKNMLHRDIKPDNIIITKGSRAVLIDFGAARDYSDNKTIAQTAIVTPGYAPIEQYNKSSRKGKYTDIYALGGTLYFLLTGKKPMDATERIYSQLKAPHQVNPNVSIQVSSLIMLAMQMKPEDRFSTVTEIKHAFNQLLNVEDTTAANTPIELNLSKEEWSVIVFVVLIVIVLFFYFLSK